MHPSTVRVKYSVYPPSQTYQEHALAGGGSGLWGSSCRPSACGRLWAPSRWRTGSMDGGGSHRVRARLPPKNGFDTPPKYVFSPFSLYLQCILSAIHPLYLRHSDVLYRCVFSRYVVRYRSGIGLHAWCLHVLSIQYMRLYRRFSILNDTHRYMTSLSPLPRGCCACVSIQEAPSCPLV